MKQKFRPVTLLLALAAEGAMLLLNFALPMREPLAFALFSALLFVGFDPFLAGGAYLLSSAVSLSAQASLSAAVQALFLVAVTLFYRFFGRRQGIERFLWLVLAQLPFVFLFPHGGYAFFPFGVLWQKAIVSALILLLSVLFEGGTAAIKDRLFKAKLSAAQCFELAVMWTIAGMGAAYALGSIAFTALSLCALFLFSVLLAGADALPLAIVLALPSALIGGTLLPVAEYVLFASAALLFLPYGKLCAAVALFVTFSGAMYLEGLYALPALDIALRLLSCALPLLAVALLPDKKIAALKRKFLFYREKTLPRAAVNRSRRAVGEQLYEVSALFREIENAFRDDGTLEAEDKIKSQLMRSLCTGCPERLTCERTRLFDSFDKLIAVGKAKGKVNLIDLPAELSARCRNSAGLLFSLNRHLSEYRKTELELESAREGRKLLAEQAHGVSEILKNLALEQSEEYRLSDREHALFSALAREGMLSTEIFVYGEGEHLTASFILGENESAQKLARAAGEVLGVPLSLSEKLPLTADRACFVLKPKPVYDATFGVAARTKDGELSSGDTHSILKIDERRFIVALSDGMGSGEGARTVSDRTLSLVESFYKAKMPSETVLSTVNSLVAYSADERFSCLDLASVSLDTGIADVVKIGAPPGFVLSGETLQVLEGESLPIGVLDAVRPASLRVEMQADDFLIFMSDGVTSAFGSSSELCNYLSRLHPLNPQSLAEEILKNALGRYRGRAEDDMTVVTVKLTKTA